MITMELNFARFTKIIIILPGTMAASEEILEAILFYHNRFVLVYFSVFIFHFWITTDTRTETTRNDLPLVGKYSPNLWLVYFTIKSSRGWSPTY